MDNNKGWIKLHRKIIDKGYYKKSQYVHLWLHLLLKANHKNEEFMWNSEIIIIKDGQFLTGRKELSQETGIPESSIEDILKIFERQHQIQQQKTTKYRIITILNWKEHQQSDIKSNNRATTEQQQADTNKNDNNDKNEKNIIQAAKPQADINKFIKLFESVNPSYEQLFKNKTQRGAMERLLKKWGEEKIEATIKALPEIIIKPYAPKIITPYDLEKDFGKLIAFYKQQQSKVADNTKKSRIIK